MSWRRGSRVSDCETLKGIIRFITSGKHSGVIILIARTSEEKGKGLTAFLITHDMPGFKVGRLEEKMGQCASDMAQRVTAQANQIHGG